jgi:hypothetical protein
MIYFSRGPKAARYPRLARYVPVPARARPQARPPGGGGSFPPPPPGPTLNRKAPASLFPRFRYRPRGAPGLPAGPSISAAALPRKAAPAGTATLPRGGVIPPLPCIAKYRWSPASRGASRYAALPRPARGNPRLHRTYYAFPPPVKAATLPFLQIRILPAG